jgi:hypothetical protein
MQEIMMVIDAVYGEQSFNRSLDHSEKAFVQRALNRLG